VFEGLNVFDVITIKEEKYWVREYLLGLKVDNTKVFLAIEYGGKYSKDVIIIVSLKSKLIARKWIAEVWRKIIKIDSPYEYKHLSHHILHSNHKMSITKSYSNL